MALLCHLLRNGRGEASCVRSEPWLRHSRWDCWPGRRWRRPRSSPTLNQSRRCHSCSAGMSATTLSRRQGQATADTSYVNGAYSTSGYAYAGPGVLRVATSATGSGNGTSAAPWRDVASTASAEFLDQVTISAPGINTGTNGRLVATILFDGAQTATGSAISRWTISVNGQNDGAASSLARWRNGRLNRTFPGDDRLQVRDGLELVRSAAGTSEVCSAVRVPADPQAVLRFRSRTPLLGRDREPLPNDCTGGFDRLGGHELHGGRLVG